MKSPFPHPSLSVSPPLSPPPPNPPATLQTVLRSISSFIAQASSSYSTSGDLVLSSINPSLFCDFQSELGNSPVLSAKIVDSLRYDYSPEASTLTIRCMLTPVHDALPAFANWLLKRMNKSQFLSDQEDEMLISNAGGDVTLPLLPDLPRDGLKSGGDAAVKQADAAYWFIGDKEHKPSRYPRVVFEVAFSQSLESVRLDAAHWLLRGQGVIKLVVIIKLNEGPVGVENHGPSSATAEKPSSDGDTPSPVPSTASDHQKVFESDPAKWVGPISGFLELYRYNAATKTVFQDGEQYNIFDPGLTPRPRINISDLLPEEAIDGDPTRSVEIPLERYITFLNIGVRQLADNRCSLQKRRKRKLDDTSGEYKSEDNEGLLAGVASPDQPGEASGRDPAVLDRSVFSVPE